MSGMWFYVPAGSTDQLGPVSEDEIRSLLATNQLAPSSRAWTEGMPGWKPLTAIPIFSTMPGAPTEPHAEIPSDLPGWMTFVGILTIFTGAMYCLQCVMLPWGILSIVAGAALLSGRSLLLQAGRIPVTLVPFFKKLNLFLLMTGWFYIISIAAVVLVFIFVFVFFSTIMSTLGSYL